MAKPSLKSLQKATQNNSTALIQVKEDFPDILSVWIEAYFKFEVTTSEASRKEQRRDLNLFKEFMVGECKSEDRRLWSPRLSSDFRAFLKKGDSKKEKRAYSDRTINRIMAHLKTFSKWIHKLRAFPLGDPMAKIKLMSVGTGLEIERAITPAERRRILDAADSLPASGGQSKDRHRFRGQERPKRKGYRGFRNRAIIYTLIETGMRRAAVTRINLKDIDFKKKNVGVEEKGGLKHNYKITTEGIRAIADYLDNERSRDDKKWKSEALFLAPAITPHGNGRLNPRVINTAWNDVCKMAGVEGRTPHSARHAVGKHIIEKTGNIAAVQRQLGHKNAAYSMQYARISDKELEDVLEDR